MLKFARLTAKCIANSLCKQAVHVVQLMPLPPIISCFSKIQNGLPFWCRLTQVFLEKRAIKHIYVRIYVCIINTLV